MLPLHTASIDPCRPLSTHTHTHTRTHTHRTVTNIRMQSCRDIWQQTCGTKTWGFFFFFFLFFLFLIRIAAPSLTGSFSASSQPGKIFLQHVLSRKLQFSNIPVRLFAEQSCSSVRGTVPNSVVQFFFNDINFVMGHCCYYKYGYCYYCSPGKDLIASLFFFVHCHLESCWTEA